MKYYDPKNKRLVFEEEKADQKFWDNLWEDTSLKSFVESGKKDRFVSYFTKKFLKPKKSVKILEGGCGKGQYVYALNFRGYDARGIDFAPKIVQKLNILFPQLPISLGDVRKTDFPNEYFDGYWSLGVIEHFYSGYNDILKEASRILKPGGYLFLTFPYMSPIRNIRARLGKYKQLDKNFSQNNFYQFALNKDRVRQDLRSVDFEIVYERPLDGLKGLKDEIDIPIIKTILLKIYYGKGVFFAALRNIIYILSSPLCGHIVLIVARKKIRPL